MTAIIWLHKAPVNGASTPAATGTSLSCWWCSFLPGCLIMRRGRWSWTSTSQTEKAVQETLQLQKAFADSDDEGRELDAQGKAIFEDWMKLATRLSEKYKTPFPVSF